MIEFGVEREGADGEQDERDVGIHQIVEDLFLEGHAKSYDGLAGEIHSDLLAVEALEGFALHLAEKIVLAGGDVVDQVLRQGFLVGEGFRFAHGAFGERDIAAAPGNDRAHQSGGIVLNLLLHFVIGLDRGRAEEQDGMSRSGVSSGSHGRYVGRFEDEDSRRTGAAAAGRHVNDDRDLRRRDLLDDLARGFDQASGSIDLDQYSLIVAARSFVDGAGDVFLGDGLNGVVNDDPQDFGEGCGTESQSRHDAENNSRDGASLHRSRTTIFLLLFANHGGDFFGAAGIRNPGVRAAPFLLIKLLVYKIQRDGNRLHEIEWRKFD